MKKKKKRQVKWSGIPISWRIFQFIVIHTGEGFGVVNKAEIDVFLGKKKKRVRHNWETFAFTYLLSLLKYLTLPALLTLQFLFY